MYVAANEQQILLPAIQITNEAFDNVNPKIIEEAIEQAIIAGEEIQMQEYANTIILASMSMKNYFPEYYFDLIITLLKQEEFSFKDFMAFP
ncbi:hypothetical protein [Trichormus azollae]|jgi:hypothetical protein|uniref:Uncharacterized protein n=1 Tax=Nostoc azollae (strain 0708) TaxID=551115 RepID=D7E567_NOSA0|nr:hypothetical protein [Trichormus azollae]ADI63864.1 conserved hypothetical protein ['Nostoc azollae' 0708]